MEEIGTLKTYRTRMVIRGFLAIYALIATICSVKAQHATIGVDWGEEYVEVAIGFRGHKPDILLNDTGSRKFYNAVALEGETRAFDQKAVAKLLKTPSKVIHRSAHIIGIPVTAQSGQGPVDLNKDDVIRTLEDNGTYFEWDYAPYEFAADENGQLHFKIGTQGIVKAEEVAGHFFNYIKSIVISNLKKAKVITNDEEKVGILAVIAVPCNYTQNQRRAIVYAAESADILVAKVVHGITAASTLRAFDQAPGKKKVLFCDIGSSGANIGVIEINVPEKDNKKSKSTEETQINVLSCVTREGIGGRYHDIALAQHLRKIFESKTNVALMPEYPNALQKLVKAANKAKIALTISDATTVAIEGLIRNVDFTPEQVTKETFNSLIQDSVNNIETTIHEAMELAGGLKMEDLDGVEIIGGASRVPAVQNKLVQIVAPQQLGFHLNAEEAVAVGAGYLAAAHNPFFKMRSAKIGDASVHLYEVSIVSTDTTHPDAIEKHTPLFKPGAKLNGSKSLVFKTKLDFNVTLKENGKPITLFHGTGVNHMINLEENKDKIAQITLVFMADHRGVITIVKSVAMLIDPEEDTTQPESETPENKTQETSEATPEQEVKPPTSFVIDLQITNIQDAFTKENLEASKLAIETLDKRDMDVVKRSESKNYLESMIYKYKGAIKETGFQEACNEETIKQISNMVNEYETWFDEESYNATLQEFEEKIDKLKQIATPVQARWAENEARPALVTSTQKVINKLQSNLEELMDKKPYLQQMTDILDTFKSVQTWWDDVQKKQEELKPNDEPAFNANSIKLQIEIAKQALTKLQKTPPPKPKKEEIKEKPVETQDMEQPQEDVNETVDQQEEQPETPPTDEL
ncbi:Hsp70 family protein [Babesia bovis T2Bo]|uniref:DnaK family domain containing protein n=1 Tax=Babesia bovis TaxID=5865 RepID=A7AWL8_BABBO|nr:Hsp70 family protein [Babesia bovis T2Bo]EDO05446.1 Hsp70 family protein [Babesia bovis T2Bo]|eukprot:XP_001609014.1 DnaK family domain containing protein [Babesia bovis T2Bo]